MFTAQRVRYCAAALLLAFTACSGDDTSSASTTGPVTESAGGDSSTASSTTTTTRPPVVTLVRADGMTLPSGPVSLAGIAETEAGTIVVAGSDFDSAGGVRVPTVWEGPTAGDLTATTLPGLEPGAAGSVATVVSTGTVTLAGGSSSREGDPHPVVWERDGGQWQLLELPVEAEGSVLAVDADGDRYAAVTASRTERALWISDRGGDWDKATGFPLLEDSIVGVAVTPSQITVAGFEEGTALLTSTADGATYTTVRFPGATISTIADDGTTIIAGGATGRTEQVPAIWRSTDGLTWEQIGSFGGDAQSRTITAVTRDSAGFVATSQFAAWTSVDGASWELLRQAAVPGAVQTTRIGSDFVAVTGGEVATLAGNDWVTSTIGPTITDAPAALDTAALDDVFVVIGRNAAEVPAPAWRSTNAATWELSDVGAPTAQLAVTDDRFAALSNTDADLSLLTLLEGQPWQSQPIALAETGFFANGLAASGDTVIVYGDDAEVDGRSGGAMVVWNDTTQPPTVVQPAAFVNDASQFTNLDALCMINPEVWVALGGRQDLEQTDGSGVEVQAATTTDGGETWETQTVRMADGSFASVQDCAITTDDRVVVWGTSQSESSIDSWVSISPDRDTWLDATPADLAGSPDLITSIVQLADMTVAFGTIDGQVVAWSLEGTAWQSFEVPGLGHPPLAAATDGTRVVLVAADPSQAVVYEGLLTGFFGG